MDASPLSDMGRLLEQSVKNAAGQGGPTAAEAIEPTIHVPNVGTALLSAYEQLRVASENIDDHLLFQSAVKRFYKRNLLFATNKSPTDLAAELVIELTLAGYLKNNSVTHPTIRRLDDLIAREYASYWEMLKPDERLRHDVAQKWVLESLSVKTEQVFNSPAEILAFAAFAYQHFSKMIDVGNYLADDEKIDEADYPVVLYIAIHKSLLGSNDANVRNALYEMYAPTISDATGLIAFHIKYDRLAAAKTTSRVSQALNRNGAPLRILRTSCFNQFENFEQLELYNKMATQELFSRKIDVEYKTLRHKLTRGIIRSIAFLLITKALVGLLIEIPYDLYVEGEVAVVPLVINLLFPPLFIALTGLTLRIPSAENKRAIIDYLTGLLYEPRAELTKIRPPRKVATSRARAFNLLYLVIFLLMFYLVSRGLALLGFNLMQGIIFFVFLSTASFLGYRLALLVKEYELVPNSDGLLGLLRDTIYAPFVVVGRRISYRFARLNIVSQVLDNLIELPLTTLLRLLRQWTAFLRNKQDEINQ